MTGLDARQIANVVARLTAELEASPCLVGQVVLGCQRDLDAAHPAALPELVERLARERLSQALAPASPPSSGASGDGSDGRLMLQPGLAPDDGRDGAADLGCPVNGDAREQRVQSGSETE